MELGGKSPAIVFADADLDAALDSTLFGVFSLNGERCTAGSRILVERSIYDDFVRPLRRPGEEHRGRRPARPEDRGRRARAPGALRQGDVLRRARQDRGPPGRRRRAPGAPAATATTWQPTVFADVEAGCADLPGGDLRPGRRASPRSTPTTRRSSWPTRVKYGLAAYMWTSDLRRAHTFAAADRGRHGVAELAQRARPAHPVRRREGLRPRPRGRLPLDRLLHRPAGRAHHARRRPHRPLRQHRSHGPTRRDRHRRQPEPFDAATIRRPQGVSHDPAPDIIRSAYAELIVTDLAASRAFYVDVLGLVVTDEDENALYLRAFEEYLHHSSSCGRARSRPLAALAYRVRSPARRRPSPRTTSRELGCRVERRAAGASPAASATPCAWRTRSASRSSSSTRPSTSSGSRGATTCTAPGPSSGSTTSTW